MFAKKTGCNVTFLRSVFLCLPGVFEPNSRLEQERKKTHSFNYDVHVLSYEFYISWIAIVRGLKHDNFHV